jgi:hypothetical protein
LLGVKPSDGVPACRTARQNDMYFLTPYAREGIPLSYADCAEAIRFLFMYVGTCAADGCPPADAIVPSPRCQSPHQFLSSILAFCALPSDYIKFERGSLNPQCLNNVIRSLYAHPMVCRLRDVALRVASNYIIQCILTENLFVVVPKTLPATGDTKSFGSALAGFKPLQSLDDIRCCVSPFVCFGPDESPNKEIESPAAVSAIHFAELVRQLVDAAKDLVVNDFTRQPLFALILQHLGFNVRFDSSSLAKMNLAWADYNKVASRG